MARPLPCKGQEVASRRSTAVQRHLACEQFVDDVLHIALGDVRGAAQRPLHTLVAQDLPHPVPERHQLALAAFQCDRMEQASELLLCP
eukprot:10847273-Lingulodinium_polyedra.AAC.1